MALLRKILFSKIVLVLLAIALFLFLVVTTAPARIITAGLQKAVPQLQLSPGKGSLWNGHCDSATVYVQGLPIDLGKLSWHFKGLKLLMLKPTIELSSEAEFQSLNLQVAVSPLAKSAEISPASGTISLNTISQFYPIPVNGIIDFDVEKAKIKLDTKAKQPEILALDGVVEFKAMTWLSGDSDIPLGNYKADAAWQNEELNIKIKDDNARLGINGELKGSLAGQYSADLVIIARENLDEEIKNTLRFIEPSNSQGEIPFKKFGRWK